MANQYVKENIVPPEERIDLSTWQLMTVASAGADLLQAGLTIFAPIVSPIIFLTFWVWLKFHGVGISDNIKRIVIMWGGFLVELIPGLNILPAWTLTIFITVLLVRNRDKRKIKEFYKNIADAKTRKKRYNVRTIAPYVTTQEANDDNYDPQEFKKAA